MTTFVECVAFCRLMSDYEVTLVNDSMQEFFVWFYGPSESKSEARSAHMTALKRDTAGLYTST